MTYSTLIVVGRLGKDPEMRYTASGAAVTSFSIATDRKYPGADGAIIKETTWFRVSVWGKQAESCNQYLTKGKMVLVEGRLNVDPKTGGPKTFQRGDGTTGASFEVTANQVRFLSSGTEGGGGNAPGEDAGGAPGGEEEIPF